MQRLLGRCSSTLDAGASTRRAVGSDSCCSTVAGRSAALCAPSISKLCVSSQQCAGGWRSGPPQPAGRRAPQPCRITNYGKEVYDAVGKKDDDNVVETYETLLPDGTTGVLESHIKRPFLDAMADDEVDLVETEYWFNPPREGNLTTTMHTEALEECESNFPQPFHHPESFLTIEDDAGEQQHVPRISFEEIEEQLVGETILGVVTDIWLYHGLQVDFGGQWDGLVPIREEEFEAIADKLEPGMVVAVTVHKLMRPGLYRWPVVLKLDHDEIAPLIMDPDDYWHPVNHAWAYAQGWSLEQLLQATNRTYEPAKVFMRPDDEEVAWMYQDHYGKGVEGYERVQEDPALEEYSSHRMGQVDLYAEDIAYDMARQGL